MRGDAKHLRHSEYTIYTDGSKKTEGPIVYHYKNKYTHKVLKC